MEKLTLEHLAPYLPYGLKIKHKDNDIRDLLIIDLYPSVIDLWNKHGVKPILRPLSDLTKEIEHNGERFVPIVEIEKIFINPKASYIGWDVFSHHPSSNIRMFDYAVMNKLIEWHFDVFGLIADGLAVHINTLEGGLINE